MGERPIFSTRAHVFVIDPESKKKWLPSSSAAVPVSFYHDTTRGIYRIICTESSKILINCTLEPSMAFTKTSQKFGQWSDSQTIYGLGFANEADLVQFIEKFDSIKALSSNINTQAQNGSPKFESDDVLQQAMLKLKHENENLKLALSQSSANAHKWETELLTLRNTNQRLSSAIQESATNVDLWNKQLTNLKEDNARLKTQLNDGNLNVDASKKLLEDANEKLVFAERIIQERNKEINELKIRVDNLLETDVQSKNLKSKIQSVEDENVKLRDEVRRLEGRLAQSMGERSQKQLAELQSSLSLKINELYEMNDKLAELIRS